MDIKCFIFIFCVGIFNYDSVNGIPQGKTGCTRPTRIKNGNFMLNAREKTVTYYCNTGYGLVGGDVLKCDGNKWSGNLPVCAAYGCPQFELLRHGTIVYNHEMRIVTFECDRGYKLTGPNKVICQEGGWSDSMPSCEGRYTKPVSKHVENLLESDYTCITKEQEITPPRQPFTRKSTEWAMAGGQPRLYTVYRCDWGYVPVGRQQNMYCKKGEWVGVKQQCKYVGKVTHHSRESMSKLKSQRTHSDWLKYADYTCLSDSGNVEPLRINNGEFHIQVAISDGMPHMYVKYECKKGYTLRANKQFMYCIEKKWWGHIPMCVKE